MPRGLSFLRARAGSLLTPVGEGASVPADGAYLLEPLLGGANPRLASPRLLLARTPDLRPFRVNGGRAPAVTLLSPGDQVQLEGGRVVHVGLFQRPFVGRATRDLVGRRCGFCRTAIGPGDVVYGCWRCDTPVHHGSLAEAGEEPLECASLAPSCPVCGGRIVLVERIAGVPELWT